MFYSKKLLLKKIKNYKLSFSAFASGMNTEIDEAILPYKYAKLCYNYNIKSGALNNGRGFKDLCMPRSYDDISNERKIIIDSNVVIDAVWHFKYYDKTANKPMHQVLYYTRDGKIYWFKMISIDPFCYPIAQECLYPNGVPMAVNYRLDDVDYLIFSSPADGMWKYTSNYAVQNIPNGPCFASMCLHYERLFAIMEGERNRLKFSANLDPTNFDENLTEGGYIDMQDERGKLNKVVSFHDYVYVFRDFGVARISAYGDQASFSVSQLFISSSKIYGESVCVCGDKILLLARDGVHVFDGYSTNKLNLGLDKLLANVKNDNCCTLYHNGKYFLACRLDYHDNQSVGCENWEGGYINNTLLELNIETNDLTVTRGVDIKSMMTVDDGNFCKVVACFNGEFCSRLGEMTEDGEVFGVPLKKVWTSPKSNFGYPARIKTVKEFFIKTNSPCKVEFKTEKQTKSYSVNASEVTQRVRTNVCGEHIEVSFVCESAGDTSISCPEVIIGVS